jgi:GntR family transcriptional regulator
MTMVEPRYQQIAEDLRRQIEAGELAPGDQILTEVELRERYRASRNTVRDAIKWLVTRGLVLTRAGDGTFVKQKIVPFVTTTTADPATGFLAEDVACGSEAAAEGSALETSEPRVELQRANAGISAELRIEEGAPIISRGEQRHAHGAAWSLRTAFYPMRLVEQGAHRLLETGSIIGGTVSYLQATLGIGLAGWRERITVRVPSATECTFFKLPGDGRIPVIESRRTGYDTAGRPFVVVGRIYPADRNELVINVGVTPAAEAALPGRVSG